MHALYLGDPKANSYNFLDVLTSFNWLKGDSRLKEMIDILSSKVDKNGRFTPESIYTKLNGWEFSQKKEPSRFLTLIAHKTLLRIK